MRALRRTSGRRARLDPDRRGGARSRPEKSDLGGTQIIVFGGIWRSGVSRTRGLGGDVRAESHLDAAGGLAADGHVEEADGVGHLVCWMRVWGVWRDRSLKNKHFSAPLFSSSTSEQPNWRHLGTRCRMTVDRRSNGWSLTVLPDAERSRARSPRREETPETAVVLTRVARGRTAPRFDGRRFVVSDLVDSARSLIFGDDGASRGSALGAPRR